MTREGGMYGPDITFLGVPRVDLGDGPSLSHVDVVVIGAPYDAGTSHRPGARFGPQAARATAYLAHDGSRPHLALGVDPLRQRHVVDAGDVEMPGVDSEASLHRLEDAVAAVAGAGALPVVLGGDHTIAWPDVTGVARHLGMGRVSVVHFDAHADTGDTQFGSLIGHGTPMRRLIESGAVRGDRFLQIGLRGYWPEPQTLDWMARQRMRSYEMTEITFRGLDECLTEALTIATDDCEGVFLSVDVDVVDPGMAPGTGTPEPGGLTSRQLLDAVRRIAMEAPLAGVDVVEVAPPYDHAEVTAYLANRVVLEVLSGIAWRRSQTGRPGAPGRSDLPDRPGQEGREGPPAPPGPPGPAGPRARPAQAGRHRPERPLLEGRAEGKLESADRQVLLAASARVIPPVQGPRLAHTSCAVAGLARLQEASAGRHPVREPARIGPSRVLEADELKPSIVAPCWT